MRRMILLLPLALAFSSADAAAADGDQPTARQVLQLHEQADVDIRKMSEIYLAGMERGLSWANAYLGNRGQARIYCQPNDSALTISQIIDMIRQTVKDYPGRGDFPVSFVFITTLQRTFPCKE